MKDKENYVLNSSEVQVFRAATVWYVTILNERNVCVCLCVGGY
jgi:hypothetical protein